MALVRAREPSRVVDLGCGTGALTVALHRHVRARETLGIDSSPAMLERAQALDTPGVHFAREDIEAFHSSSPYDLVFSNAALQWVADHPRLFERLTTLIAPGGELAVQVPANFDHPSHTLAARVAREPEFAQALEGYVRESPVLPPEEYATLLHRLGFADQHVRLQVYGHLLESTAELVEWTRGTLLTDYAVRMPDALFARYVDAYRRALLSELGEQRPYFFAFKRILIWAALRR